MFKKLNQDQVNIFISKGFAWIINAVNLFTMLLLFTFAIMTIKDGILMFIITKPLIGSLSFGNIITHNGAFPYLTTLNILSHSSKDTAVQIVIVRSLAMLINEIALLSIIAGLFVFKKSLSYLLSDTRLIVNNKTKVSDKAFAISHIHSGNAMNTEGKNV
jgi:hypothetical protein